MGEAKRRPMGYNEELIARALRVTSNLTEQVRVQQRARDGVDGYAVEVTREIFGDEYSYFGWISMSAFKHEPWPIDQRHMIDRAFQTTYHELINQPKH